MDAPAAMQSGRQGRSGVSLASFVFHEHSFLGLFVPDGHAAPPIQPCCCLCVATEALTRRQRIFIFAVVFALMIGTSVEVDLGVHGSVWSILVQIFLVVPITLHLKAKLPNYSAWFRSKGIGPFGPTPQVRAEEIVLIAGMIYSVISMAQHTAKCGDECTNECACTAALEHALSAWVGALVTEAATLPFFYYCACSLHRLPSLTFDSRQTVFLRWQEVLLLWLLCARLLRGLAETTRVKHRSVRRGAKCARLITLMNARTELQARRSLKAVDDV